jgi:hypothetical protein
LSGFPPKKGREIVRRSGGKWLKTSEQFKKMNKIYFKPIVFPIVSF